MLVAAENKIIEPPADASAFVRKIIKPFRIVFKEFFHCGIAVRAADAVYAARLQAAEHILNMALQVRKMFCDMMRVEGVYRCVGKGKACAQVGPYVAFCGEHIGIDIYPALNIVPLARSQVDAHILSPRRTGIAIYPAVEPHQR